MDEIREGYKMVSVYRDETGVERYGSAIISQDGIPIVEYNVGEWTKPRFGEGPLAVFDTLQHAQRFRSRAKRGMDLVGRNPIFTCEYVPSIVDYLWFMENNITWGTPVTPVYETPIGTVLADKVKLLENIQQKLYIKKNNSGTVNGDGKR